MSVTGLLQTTKTTHSALWEWWQRRGDLLGDAILYALSSAFALGTYAVSATVAQSWWGALSAAPYLAVATMAFAASRLKCRSVMRVRVALCALVVLGAVVAPLLLLAQWRQHEPAGNYAQPEVMVIERAANLVYDGHDPYQAIWLHGRLQHAIANVPAYESYYPYFPLMSIFGAPAAFTHHRSSGTDARVVMSVVTASCLAGALVLLRLSGRHALRVTQLLIALPSGAIFLATGGDDMPLLGLMLLGVAFLARRRVTGAALTLGIAMAIKLTAWPMLLGATLVARDEQGRPRWRTLVLWAAAITLSTVVPYALLNPATFISNVVAFPLGLTQVVSPAATPLPGHILTVLWAPLGHVLTPLTLLVGGYFLAKHLRRHWPLTLSHMLGILALGTTVVILTSSATRSGYVIYPMNFWLWSHVTKEPALV